MVIFHCSGFFIESASQAARHHLAVAIKLVEQRGDGDPDDRCLGKRAVCQQDAACKRDVQDGRSGAQQKHHSPKIEGQASITMEDVEWTISQIHQKRG